MDTPNPTNTSSSHYVDKAQLMVDICDWQDACQAAREAGQEEPRMYESIGRAILAISTNMGTRWNFSGYSWVDEMVLDGIVAATRAVPKFDRAHPKKNPFGFLSFIIWRAFLARIKSEKEEQEGRMSMMLDETIAAYNTQDADSDIELSKSELIGTYSFNSGE
ncbi:late sigma transcription factor [Acidovorax phage ACP17]|uniref:RNA polymerase sigma factor for late transcription n=1 Tax=Acidovorax phage ACP17 TaxID=2010329 RepID=A0A223AIZ4_9CAUD|nr:late sigma transcription factor [Acidovorax phage ACP17]ASS33940.1 hypothetical protein [Acidovorax phage ACP17]